MTDEDTLLTRLDEAIKRRDTDSMRRLVAGGLYVNGNPSPWKRRPPMNEAAALDFVAGLEILFSAGGLVDGLPTFHNTPLTTAADEGSTEAARWLLHHGAQPLAANRQGETALEIALKLGYLDIAIAVAQQPPGIRDDDLVAAAKKSITRSRNADVIRWLLDSGVDPNITGPNGQSWLMLVQSTAEEYAPLSMMLIAAGADVNFQDVHGGTALHRTVTFKALPGFMRLLRAGANPHLATVRETLEKSPMHRDMLDALVAWEASQSAHQVLAKPVTGTKIKPL